MEEFCSFSLGFDKKEEGDYKRPIIRYFIAYSQVFPLECIIFTNLY